MKTGNTTYRFAVGVALVAAFILVWLSLDVGIIGRDGDLVTGSPTRGMRLVSFLRESRP